MRRSPATMINAPSGETVLAMLAACTLLVPAVAIAGVDTLCDQDSHNNATLDIEVADLSIELTDVPANQTFMPVDLDIAIDLDEYQVPLPDDHLQIERLFDQAHVNQLPDSISPRDSIHPPLVELSKPAVSDSSAELLEEPVDAKSNDAADAPPAVNTRVPGLSQDDLQRYRQRMYRTDI